MSRLAPALALLVCFLEGLECARLPALRTRLNSFLPPIPRVALTVDFEVHITLPDAMVGQRLTTLFALTCGDMLFAATLLNSTTAGPSLFIGEVFSLPDKPRGRHRAIFGLFRPAAFIANFFLGPRHDF